MMAPVLVSLRARMLVLPKSRKCFLRVLLKHKENSGGLGCLLSTVHTYTNQSAIVV